MLNTLEVGWRDVVIGVSALCLAPVFCYVGLS